jgi:coenzyme F420-dependent glucose-6-phosphate dehydrogenase
MIELKVSFGPDLQECLAATRHWGALALSADEKMKVTDPVEMEHLAEALPLERVASRWIVSSDADEHVEKIRSYVDLGFRHLVFHFPGTDQERSLALYAAEILPRLRARFGSVGQEG